MSPANLRNPAQTARFPRVSGDEPTWVRGGFMLLGFSPRERG